MSSGPQDLIKEILARLAASPDEARQQLLRDAIAVNGSELGPEGVEQLRKLAGFVDQANEVFPDEDLVEQNIRAGNYRIEGLIASGGMADVYKAVEPPPLEREVAIKVLRRGLLSQQAFERFRFERDSLKALDHPNIAPVFDAGDTEDGFPFIVMPFIDGDHLTQFADKHELSLPDRLRLARQIGQGLSFAHLKGLVHRD